MDAVERQVTLPADLEGAWDLLTRPDELAGWLGAEVDLEPRPGAAGAVTDHDGTRRRLVVDEVVEGHRLTWQWAIEGDDGLVGPASQVEITLTPAEDGTRVTVVERALEPAARAELQASAGAAWSHRLLHLESLLLIAAAVR
ncbi:MAG TPA: SRPBCC domain-containing protein, partial [Acidimicrobiales bacterium]|nr:SRPBCC domain-containing protein [Acidimicrobiales bacterium]